jgi:hypothetical protein
MAERQAEGPGDNSRDNMKKLKCVTQYAFYKWQGFPGPSQARGYLIFISIHRPQLSIRHQYRRCY